MAAGPCGVLPPRRAAPSSSPGTSSLVPVTSRCPTDNNPRMSDLLRLTVVQRSHLVRHLFSACSRAFSPTHELVPTPPPVSLFFFLFSVPSPLFFTPPRETSKCLRVVLSDRSSHRLRPGDGGLLSCVPCVRACGRSSPRCS